MSDQKLTHLPAEGEGTPLLPGETDLKPATSQPPAAGHDDPSAEATPLAD